MIQKFESFCEQVFIAEKPIVLGALRDIALSAVQTAEATGLDSSSKRQQAFTEITAKAQTIGVVAGASMISLALEMALQVIRGNQGKTDG